MKKSLLILACISFMMTSCRKENELEEVKIPDPEVETKISALGNPADVKVTEDGIFQMRGLKYAYDDLQPHIDGRTMEIHYSKHHLGYANKLNKAVIGTDLELKTVEDILKNLDVNNKEIRNNAGGYYNHNLFFEILNPKGGGTPTGALAEAITAELGSFDNLQKQLTEAAAGQFGSGWAWLVVTREGKLAVTSTANQDNPLMPNAEVRGTPILAIDVWEHAYYLHYQNRRPDYCTAFWNVVNWDEVSNRFEK